MQTATEKKFVFWSDVDNKFSLDKRGDLKTVYNFEAVLQSVENVLLTTKGERVMRPLWGSRLKASLFEQITEDNAREIADEILEALEQEPRVEPDYIEVIAVPDSGYYEVKLGLAVPTFGQKIEMVRILRHKV